MATPLQFDVDDSSPTISYIPFSDTFSVPNTLAGWNPYFTDSGFAAAQGDTGNGTSLHITALDGASLSLQWNGTGIQLFGNATNASYTITIDGTLMPPNAFASTNNTLADFHGLSDADHTMQLTAHTNSSPNSFMAFDKAVVVASTVDQNTQFGTKIVNDSDIAFLGRWNFQSGWPTSDGPRSFHTSSRAGDRAQSQFKGTALRLIGLSSPSAGQFSVTLDNHTTTLSARSSFSQPDALLFFATGLDAQSNHDLVIRNEEDRALSLSVGGLEVTNVEVPSAPAAMPSTTPTPAPSSGLSGGTIAALAISGTLAFFIICILLYFFLSHRPRARRARRQMRATRELERREKDMSKDWDKVEGVLDIGPTTDQIGDDRRERIPHPFGHRTSAQISGDKSESTVSRSQSSKSNSTGRNSGRRRKSPFRGITIALPHFPAQAGLPSAGSSSGSQTPDSEQGVMSPNRDEMSPSSSVHPRRGSRRHLLAGHRDRSEPSADEVANDDDDEESSALPRGIATTLASSSQEPEFASQPQDRKGTFGILLHPGDHDQGASNLQGAADADDRPMLRVRETSPFRVDFHGIGSARTSKEVKTGSERNSMGTSRIRFSQTSRTPRMPTPPERSEGAITTKRPAKGKGKDASKNHGQVDSGRRRRRREPSLSAVEAAAQRHSFLDLSSSSGSGSSRGGSVASRGGTHSGSSRSSRKQRSRWSDTTVPSVMTPEMASMFQRFGDPGPQIPSPLQTAATERSPAQLPSRFSEPSDYGHTVSLFPSPVTIPDSSYPQNQQPSSPSEPPQHPYSSFVSRRSRRPESTLEFSTSPTDSIPLTISDIHFRDADEDSHGVTSTHTSRRMSGGSHLPPHPPLPAFRPMGSTTSPLSAPPFIVQRVLGGDSSPRSPALGASGPSPRLESSIFSRAQAEPPGRGQTSERPRKLPIPPHQQRPLGFKPFDPPPP